MQHRKEREKKETRKNFLLSGYDTTASVKNLLIFSIPIINITTIIIS